MGEIAEMMLDGTMCECCGEFIGDGDGFPRYCSPQCAGDRGQTVEKKGSKRPRRKGKGSSINEWSETFEALKPIAEQFGLKLEQKNPGHPHYQIAKLEREGVRLIVYPHRVRNTGNRHARIRNEGSANKDLARQIMAASNLKIKLGGMP